MTKRPTYRSRCGAGLWSIGEHFRYTRDEEWVRQISPKLIRACEYLIAWRERNKDESLRGKGFGMIDGQVCDYLDPYRHFVLNGYACMGLSRVSEMLSSVDPQQSKKLAREAGDWRKDIRESLQEAMAQSPVVPLSNGEWCPTAPPWAEGCGRVAIFADNDDWYSEEHWNYFNRTGSNFWVRDAMLGPQYLMFQEIIGLDEPSAKHLHAFHTDMLLLRNVVSSQPYYSRHPWVHLRQGEVKSFLKAYYNCMSAQSDRETYSFPEGIVRSVTGIEWDSPHKTHEEGWFLLETRWMLYMEQDKSLNFLSGVPRSWLQNGKTIKLENVATYFGPASLHVESNLSNREIHAMVECLSDHQPQCVQVRLPHPDGRLPTTVKGGSWDPHNESVRVERFQDRAEIVLRY